MRYPSRYGRIVRYPPSTRQSQLQPCSPLRSHLPWRFIGLPQLRRHLLKRRSQLAGGTTPDGKRILSVENLAYTHTPKVAISDKVSYALGWFIEQTPNGGIVRHSGGTRSFGSMVVLQLDRKLGVVVLTNQGNVGMPDAIGLWAIDRLLGNPVVDHAAKSLALAKTAYGDSVQQYARPASPLPSPPLAPLAGNFANPGFGKAVLRTDGDMATVELLGSGAKLRLDPWNGGVYTATLVPEGRFAAVAVNLGPLPSAFAQFQSDKDGKPTILRLTFATGQAYDFKRE